MTNNFSEPSYPSYSDHFIISNTEIKKFKLGIDILVLKQLSMITNEELVSLMRMIKSPDLENFTMAETIVNDLLKKVDDEYTRKT